MVQCDIIENICPVCSREIKSTFLKITICGKCRLMVHRRCSKKVGKEFICNNCRI